MTRDPRKDPRPGDKLGMRGSTSWVRVVVSRPFPHRVVFAARVGNQWLGKTMTETFAEWCVNTQDAEVIHRAEEEK